MSPSYSVALWFITNTISCTSTSPLELCLWLFISQIMLLYIKSGCNRSRKVIIRDKNRHLNKFVNTKLNETYNISKVYFIFLSSLTLNDKLGMLGVFILLINCLTLISKLFLHQYLKSDMYVTSCKMCDLTWSCL